MGSGECAVTDEAVLILAPVGRDAVLAASTLHEAGIQSRIVQGLDELARQLSSQNWGAVLLAEEALQPGKTREFFSELGAQEKWSDIPIILLTGGGQGDLSPMTLELFGASGNITLLERPCRPVTISRLLQAAIRARRRQYDVRGLLVELASAVQLRDEFMSIASHELKTPLTSLKLQTQISERMIERGDPRIQNPERLRKLVTDTGKQLDRLGRLVEDMLDVSRITTGKLSIARERMSLTALISELIERLTPQLTEAGCQTDFHFDEAVEGEWDRFRIEQVLINLLNNAIKYCAGKPVHVSLRDQGNWAEVVVADEGPGIAPADHDRLFKRFERAVKASRISGLGLGLYISRQIIETHGGTISLESELGQGARFTVRLPKQS